MEQSQQQQYLSPSPFFDTPPTPTTPDSVTWTHDSTRLLGRGTSGTVFLGTFNGIEAAVKRVGKLDFRNPAADQNREEKAMTKLNHPNILRLFYVASDDHFKYFVMELCVATINNYCTGKYNGPMPPSEQLSLHQMNSGLAYIHSKGYVHRDIKPDNVLIFVHPETKQVSLKISDFGMSKPVSSSGTFSLTSGVKGTQHFYSPELLQLADEEHSVGSVAGRRANVSSDVFALGCLFYVFLTRGKHPFSNGRPSYFIAVNILEGKHNLNDLKEDQSWAKPIIVGMIHVEPGKRWGLEHVDAILQTVL